MLDASAPPTTPPVMQYPAERIRRLIRSKTLTIEEAEARHALHCADTGGKCDPQRAPYVMGVQHFGGTTGKPLAMLSSVDVLLVVCCDCNTKLFHVHTRTTYKKVID